MVVTVMSQTWSMKLLYTSSLVSTYVHVVSLFMWPCNKPPSLTQPGFPSEGIYSKYRWQSQPLPWR